ncbi:hypothetical protein MFLAVUS_002854 [Mucor flavus]|uniref:HTH La-type RNA-binding domain-containing protein n=1 Tax=Mucor flavus TaxID=439312 RepID=A0ABP9YRG6_9FUNG
MTVSTPESNQGTDFRKRPFVNKYKRNGNGYNRELLHYPMAYGYYPPPSVYYPPITTRDDDLETIMHDDNTNSAELGRRSDQRKTISLKEQLEYYFSRQNLVNDTYLVSQMDSDLFVPITTIANFKRVREWTTDVNLIVKALRESSTVTVDDSGTRVKPNISVERKTVILRDVPDCTEQEMMDLLNHLNSPPVQSIKQDIGNMWYFTFESEQHALQLLTSVRGKSFKEQAIAARMKSEPVLRVSYQSSNNQKTHQVGGRSLSPRVGNRQNYLYNSTEDRFSSELLTTTTNQLDNMSIREGNKLKKRFNKNSSNKTELKPASFPPLPTQVTADIKPWTNDAEKRSIADIIKSHPKKQEEKAEVRKEDTKEEKMEEKKEVKKEETETEAFPSLCNASDEFKSNTFSYADMLKRKD